MTTAGSEGLPESPAPADDDEIARDQQADNSPISIVGVGASAGGLEAFIQLLKALPPDTGMAFVLVQHLAPTHVSALAEILSRATRMPVMEVQDEPSVEPNHVYVIPPARSMVIVGGALHLLPREGRGAHHPVDQFFRSLAVDRRHRAIGVVLSGTASDGTIGLQAIKAEGGITFAQDDTAQQSGMPHSAIAAGSVDFVLPPDAIAREIVRIGKHPYTVPEPGAAGPGAEPDLSQVLRLLQGHSGVDFTDYKFNTLYRRITRRMVLRQLNDVGQYTAFLRQNPAEIEALKQKVFPRLVVERRQHDPVRVWTIGCSTGEEAYSVAMAWAEFAQASSTSVKLQVFATDLNETGITTARTGVYPKDIVQDVSPERLRRFFVEVDGQYRIAKEIRETCVFSRHNVLGDPPFSRIDLISCRNVLIYLERVLQQKVVPTLHYALKPGGFLWLGSSETVGAFRNLFEAEDGKHRLYAKKPGSLARAGYFPVQHGASPRTTFPLPATRPSAGNELHREADRLLLSRFAPPSVLVTAELEILQYRGDTGAFLSPTPGKASLHLLKMLREGLVGGVRAAVLRATKEKAPVRHEGLRVNINGGWNDVTVEVIPLDATSEGAQGGFLILFNRTGGTHEPSAALQPPPPALPLAEQDNARLTQELVDTRDYMQALVEQQEAANEELQSANEEVQSANEELQSINEELETSKEELQSSNEELATVNDELSNRNTELGRLNNDLVNLLGSIQTPIVMLGPDLRIRRFTPAAEKLFHLVPGDLGRPIGAIKLEFDLPQLESLLARVIDSVSAEQREVQDSSGRWYSLRLRPYRTLENKIDGVVMMLVDVDHLKRAHEYTQSIVRTVREPLLVLDAGLRVRTANEAFYRTFETQAEEVQGRLIYELDNGQWDIPALRRHLEDVLPRDTESPDLEVQVVFDRIGMRTMLLNARRLVQEFDQEASILLAIEDITERKRTDQQLRQYAADLLASDQHKTEFLAILAHELRNPLAPMRNAAQLLQRKRGDERALTSASQMIERQVTQMARLVDDLLDVSRISRGKIELRKEHIALAPIARDAVETARSTCDSLGLQLTVSLPTEAIYVDADPARVAQILGNLLNNACKFTSKGGQVGLAVQREGEQVVLRVRDSGIGITTEQMPRIFDMFMQGDTSLERSVSGLGIGLTMVKNLVELHGGAVEAHSAGVGQGSEFVIRLPVVDGPGPAPGPTTSEATATPHRILVVDDNRDAAVSLAELLELAGNETHVAFDGHEAVREAERLKPDLVLLDIGLPKLNGYEACRQIRDLPGGKEVTVVALTGWGQEEDRQRSREAGFDNHLVKPPNYDALMRVLASLPTGARAN